jgi:hypothetical protein
MKNLRIAAIVVGAIAGLNFASMTAPVQARDVFSFSFDTGAVAFAYSDGYWDKDRRFHRWSSARESREYRARYAHNYKNNRSSRYRNRGWRGDQDRDGVPNAYDRDRDGDGVSNRRDDSPGNPRRN